MNQTLGFTDKQLRLVAEASSLLPPSRRDVFLRSVANRLADVADPSDGQIAAAVDFVLSINGIGVGGSKHLRRNLVPRTERTFPTVENVHSQLRS